MTGANRSGTTWAGAMLARSGQLRTVYEPFNPGLWPRWTRRPLPFRNLYVCDANEREYHDEMARILAYRRPVLAQVPEARSARAAARLARDGWDSAVGMLGGRATLVKDPIAVFSAPWLADRFGLNVVLMVRNPGAFVSSILRLNWRYDFRNLADQDLLMRDLLAPFAAEIDRAVSNPPDVIDQATLLWRLHYHVIDRYRCEHPEWLCVRWEDLAVDPPAGFAALYERLGLRFDDAVRARIAADTGRGNVVEVAASDTGPVQRDSRATVAAWRRRLSDEQFQRIRSGIGNAADRFYAADEWLPAGLA